MTPKYTQQIEMIINHQHQHFTKRSSSGCSLLDTNWFNFADTTGGLYCVATQNYFSNSVAIFKDLLVLSSSMTTLEKLTISGASLTQTFQIDSGITGFNVLANLNIGDTVYLLSSSVVEIIDGTRLYYAEVCVSHDISLTDAQKFGDWTVTASYPSGGINTTDVGISFDVSIFTIDNGDGSLDLVASNKLLSKNR